MSVNTGLRPSHLLSAAPKNYPAPPQRSQARACAPSGRTPQLGLRRGACGAWSRLPSWILAGVTCCSLLAPRFAGAVRRSSAQARRAPPCPAAGTRSEERRAPARGPSRRAWSGPTAPAPTGPGLAARVASAAGAAVVPPGSECRRRRHSRQKQPHLCLSRITIGSFAPVLSILRLLVG